MKRFLSVFLAILLALTLAAAVVGCNASAKLSGFAIDDSKVNKALKVGDVINVNGLKATATYRDGSTKELTAKDVEFYHGDDKLSGTVFKDLTNSVGEVTITVRYSDFSESITFTVEKLLLSELTLNDSNIKKTVKVGDLIQVGGLKATALFDNGTTKSLSASDLTFYNGETALAGTNFSGLTAEAGTVEITVKYTFEDQERSVSLTITVEEKVPVAFAIAEANKQLQVKVGDNVNLGSLTATVTYDDESTETLRPSALEYYNGDTKLTGTLFSTLTAEAGEVTITIKYLTFTDTITITVSELEVRSLDLDTANIPWVKLGEQVDFGSITATVTYEKGDPQTLALSEISFYLADETELVLDAENKVSGISTAAGEVTITAKYKGVETTFTILVKDVSETGLVLDTSNIKTTVKVGAAINLANLKASISFSDESSKALTLDLLSFYHGEEVLTSFDGLTDEAGEVVITVKYLNFEVTITITVEEFSAVEFELNTDGMAKTTFKVGEAVDFTGITATAVLENEEHRDLLVKDIEFFYKGENDTLVAITLDSANKFSTLSATAATYTIVAEYRGQSEEFEIVIEDVVATSLVLNPAEMEVNRYESINVGDLIATVNLDFGSPIKPSVTDLIFYHGKTLLTGTAFEDLTDETGTVVITVKYTYQEQELSADLTVTVKELVATGLSPTVPNDDKTAIIGGDITLGNITATVTYNTGRTETNLTAANLKFYLGDALLTLNDQGKVSGIATKAGTLEITVKYKEASASFNITVKPLQSFNAYAAPTSESSRPGKADTFLNKNADQTRIVGDDNAFKFQPILTLFDNAAEDFIFPDAYETVSEVSVKDGDTLTKLTAQENIADKTITFSANGVLIVTSYYAKGEYQFTSAAVGKTYVIKILPKEYAEEAKSEAVNVTVKIVNGFNIYDAKDLAIIDNTTSKGWTRDANENGGWAEDQNVWAAIREEKGFTVAMSNATKAVVLQRDITITADDLPASYVGTVKRSLYYYDHATGEIVKTVEGAKRLTHDNNGVMFLYERISDNDFTFYGNFYTLDGSQIPLASAFDEEAVETDQYGNKLIIGNYGADYSNASLFRFRAATGNKRDAADRVTCAIENLNVKGNADASQWVIYETGDTEKKNPKPVNAGGFIFSKTCDCFLKTDNVNIITCFIGYILEENVTADANYIKVTSSYQNAGFLWGYCEMNVKNSELTEAGGPLFILQHLTIDHDDLKAQGPQIPTLNIVDSKVENFVTGNEMWFASMGATGIIPNLKAGTNSFLSGISGMLENYNGVRTATQKAGNRENCLNLICLIMSNGADATVLADPAPQGYCSVTQNGKTYVLDRMSDSPIRATVNGNVLIETGNATFNADGVNGLFYQDSTSPIGLNYLCGDPNQQAQLDQAATQAGTNAYIAALQAGKSTDEANQAASLAGLNVYLAAATPAIQSIYEGDFLAFNQGGMGLLLGTTIVAE